VFDRQADGQTDRILITRPHLHSMQRGNNTGNSTNTTKNMVSQALL